MADQLNAIFTNSDARLRPAGIANRREVPSGPAEYDIAAEAFPALFPVLSIMRQSVGRPRMQFVILENFGGAGFDIDRETVGIGSRMLNDATYPELLALVGHELGHAWRLDHPTAPFIGSKPLSLNDARLAEIEADRFGACLVGSTQGAIGFLNSGGKTMDPGLPIKLRVEALEDFSLDQCPATPRTNRPRTR